ncbi:hypothetical protein [Nannocystis pusilla]|uniref:Uncharacterized protein n=1 Tax=Nannocystis pusilla TaxID=889268 RepID=A0ABS7TWP6_9BACT|nr:hypothetical protein [Nannocystis pusilla]MBZ5712688.1 hypothetical protein [Nannocystis pusilla]
MTYPAVRIRRVEITPTIRATRRANEPVLQVMSWPAPVDADPRKVEHVDAIELVAASSR